MDKIEWEFASFFIAWRLVVNELPTELYIQQYIDNKNKIFFRAERLDGGSNSEANMTELSLAKYYLINYYFAEKNKKNG